MRNFVLAVNLIITAAAAHASNIVPWMTGTTNNVPDILNFSTSSVSPDGKLDFSVTVNLTMGPLTIENEQFCGGVLCYERKTATLTGTASGEITNALTHATEQTWNPKLTFHGVDFEDWFPPNTPEQEHRTTYIFSGDWPNGFATAIAGVQLVSTTVPGISRVSVVTASPEPGTLLTLASGGFLAGLGGIGRRRFSRLIRRQRHPLK